MRQTILSRAIRMVALVLPLSLAACAVNPATGQRQLMLVSESQEIRMGQEYHPRVVASYGTYDAPELAALLTEMGQAMSAAGERPDLPWQFTLLDDPSVNAFAVPGGFVYFTRGILAHLNSEAEVAGVMGHEIGHVTARHSAAQMSQQQLMTVGVIGGMILTDGNDLAAAALQVGSGLLSLKFSRDDELQSDRLGVRYMTRTGYDAREIAGVFQTLGLISGDPGDRLPEWQSTHPNPENREERIRELVAETGEDYSDDRVGRESYLRMLDGIVFGADPRQGFFTEGLFRHPEFRFRLQFPAGWQRANQATRVVAGNEAGNAMAQLTLSEHGSPSEAATAFASQDGVTAQAARSTTVNGLPARAMDFRAESENASLRGTIAFIEYEERIYEVMGLSTASAWSANSGVLRATVESFAPEDDPAVLAVQPWRIDIVEVPSAMTLEAFMERWPSIAPEERIRVLNRVAEGETLVAGRLMKRVVGEALPGS